MKQLISSFKQFLTNNRTLLNKLNNKRSFLPLLGIIAAVGCTIYGSQMLTPQGSMSLKTKHNGSTHFLAAFDPAYCGIGLQPAVKFAIPIKSPLGLHKSKLTLYQQGTNKTSPATFKVDHQSWDLQVQTPLTAEDLEKICSAALNGKETYVFEGKRYLESFQDILAKYAPDCQWQSTDQSLWNCGFNTLSAQTALNQIKSIRKAMVFRWSRQPYLLVRRISITNILAKALKTSQPLEALDRACRIINSSLPAELPLSLRSPSWQERACDESQLRETRITSAFLGLSFSIKEISNLRTKLEEETQVGTLSIRIPKQQLPSKDLWVSLRLKSKTDKAEHTTKSCWHPLFTWDSNFFIVAKELGMVSSETYCLPSAPMARKLDFFPDQYITSSITSEMEFAITNGRGKRLRLPQGDYEYQIHDHQPTANTWYPDHKPSHTSAGTIRWTLRRPKAIIQKW